MPGIAGIVDPKRSEEIALCLDSMLAAMRHRDDMVTGSCCPGNSPCVLGYSSLGVIGPERQPLLAASAKFPLVLDGEFYGAENQSANLARLMEACEYPEKGGISTLHGAFAAAGFDTQKNRLVLVSDKFGQKPLYYAEISDGGLIFASEIKALLATGKVLRTRNDQAFADCYRYGFVLGDKTLFSDVRLLPPSSFLLYDVSSCKLTITPYSQIIDYFRAGTAHGPKGLEDVVGAFVDGVTQRMHSQELIGISLSGGLDSRAVLAAMGKGSRGRYSYTLGLAGCQDKDIAGELAALSGTNHDFLEIAPDDLGDFKALAETLVFLSDGLYHPHESTEKRALDYFRSAPFRIVLRGHGGEIAKASLAYPVQAKADLAKQSRHEDGVDFIYRQANLGLRDVKPARLFSPAFVAIMTDGARQSLEEAMAPAQNRVNSADLCIYFYTTQWVRRQVLASLSVFHSQMEIRLPYLDETFLQKLLMLPVEERFAGEVQVEIVKRCAPHLVSVINSNTGAPLDAGKVRLVLTDKVNAVLKKLGLSGFRHYTEFQQWQREQFRQSIESIIFTPRTMDRGLYNPDGLRELFQLHVSGQKQYGHLFGTIVALELWHRLFVDEVS